MRGTKLFTMIIIFTYRCTFSKTIAMILQKKKILKGPCAKREGAATLDIR